MTTILAILVVLATVLFLGCGSSDSTPGLTSIPTNTVQAAGTAMPTATAAPTPTQTPTPTVVANEDGLAASMLLTLADFPTGWSEDKDEEQDEEPFDECEELIAQGSTGRAESGSFSRADLPEVSHTVAVFQQAEQARAALAGIEELGNCFVKAINDGKLDDEEATYEDASFRRVSFPVYGDVTEAWRIQARIKLKDPITEATLYIDFISVVNGRVAFTIGVADVFTPMDAEELEGFVQKANAKVRQQ
jgi:hypothetical protein